jgi:hypothetical protein
VAQLRRGPDLTGRRFGRLTVIGLFGSNNGKLWLCRCDCGQTHKARTGHLNAGAVTSCGCAQQDAGRITGWLYGHLHATHGMRHHPLYNVHRCMMRRCYNRKDKRFPSYGGRGITVCDEWRTNRGAFFNWALASGYKSGLTLERRDNDLGYSPDNCCWIPHAAQQNNTTRSHTLSWQGETLTISAWARKLGIRPNAIQHRLDRGWPVERIFSQPYRVSSR